MSDALRKDPSIRRMTIVIRVLVALLLVALGAVLGILFAAPATADLYNACVADNVVPRAGQIAPGPAANPYSDPRTRWNAPATWVASRAPQATPKPVATQR